MFRDSLTRHLEDQAAGVPAKELPPLKGSPISDEEATLRRKVSEFRGQALRLDSQASVEPSHKRSQQLYREALVAHSMADKFQRKLDEIVVEHYGRKGMKWGQKIFSKGGSGKSKKVSVKQAKKKAKKMTDKELQDYIKRSNLEKQYVNLTASEKARGRQEVRKILKASARKAVKEVTTAEMKKALNFAVAEAKKKQTASSAIRT